MKKSYIIPNIHIFIINTTNTFLQSSLSKSRPSSGLPTGTEPSNGGTNDGTHPGGSKWFDEWNEEDN